MKAYNEERHFDLGLCLSKNQAYFENIDFGDDCKRDVFNILTSCVQNISFSNCLFQNLDLSNELISPSLSFTNCTFKGQTSFVKAMFTRDVSFYGSTFVGTTDFSNADFKGNVSFEKIHTKPASGYFYFRGDELKEQALATKLYNQKVSFSKAVFETRVSFLDRIFSGPLSFSYC
ncbi:MAG: pentapeptide repeat-containing protein [Alphaproteobacteria bacterium]